MTEASLTGAQFRRDAGSDPEKWARLFLLAYAGQSPETLRTEADRVAYVAKWFEDAMDSVVRPNPFVADQYARLAAALEIAERTADVKGQDALLARSFNLIVSALRIASGEEARPDGNP